MKRFYRLFILFISYFSIASSVSSQVTIGSQSKAMPGSLLDLKEEGKTTKGLLLPRVSLQSVNSLAMIKNDDRNLGMSEHTGLMVYNIRDDGRTLCPGVYSWSGASWVRMGKECYYPLSEANSFVVSPGSTFIFPVSKAYAAWKSLEALGNIDLKGAVTVELVWQDEIGLIRNFDLYGGDKGADSKIRVYTSASIEGNALIALKVDDVIRWTWYIWVTNYNPDELSGQKTYNNGTITTVFMDRNLGALDNNGRSSAAAIKSMGYIFQWGRMAPFAPSTTNLSSGRRTHKPLYRFDGSSFSYDYVDVSSANNLPNAISNPNVLYMASKGNGYDWYSSVAGVRNDSLWNNYDNTKGVFDPCPHGWRLPLSGEDAASPWYRLPRMYFTTGQGMEWTTAVPGNQNVGYWPAAGFQDGTEYLEAGLRATFRGVGTAAFYWSASTSAANAYCLNFYHDGITPSRKIVRGSAFNIRCVKE